MAKTRITVESDLGDLVKDMLRVAEQFPEVILEAADAQMEVLSDAIKTNWSTMINWKSESNYVYDSIGYNTDNEETKDDDVVGMAGVFFVDSVASSYGKTDKDMTAPNLAYWAEFGYAPRGAPHQAGVPYMMNAYLTSLATQESIFADTLSAAIAKRIKK